MQFDLERFYIAQNSENHHYNYSITNYESAIQELESGNKESHWIWFLFPQIKGLGISPDSEYYGLAGINEAKEYLNHPVLSERLINCFNIIYNIDKDLFSIFKEDEKKVWACATLFSLANDNHSEVFNLIIEKYFNKTNHFKTIELLNNDKNN
jgi:uncharacterized protein (DUF1810 family)